MKYKFLDFQWNEYCSHCVITNRNTNELFGKIEYSPKWRQLVFSSNSVIIWSGSCLGEVIQQMAIAEIARRVVVPPKNNLDPAQRGESDNNIPIDKPL